jgi:quercetin dioxygenase-like cupin family protein
MKHVNYVDVPPEEPNEPSAKGMRIRWLITQKDGAKNFAMRLFEVEPGGYTPWHQHQWEHEIFILEGEGRARGEKGEEPFRAGDVFFISPMEWHQIKNTGTGLLRFLCLIPYNK